jgi:hypothetical protein
MSEDHRTAQARHVDATLEHHRWREVLREMRAEHHRVLLKISTLFRMEEIELDAVEERIEDHALLVEEHAAAIAEHEEGGDGATHEAWEELHAELEAVHERVGRQVQRLQEHHRRSIAVLRRALEEASGEGPA